MVCQWQEDDLGQEVNSGRVRNLGRMLLEHRSSHRATKLNCEGFISV